MLENLEVFFGDANNAEARVYARLPAAGLPGNCVLTGRVVGPTCEYSRTLPAAIPFLKQRRTDADGNTLLLEAIVPDPCFWSQELPFLYRAELELRSGDQALAAFDRGFGVRPLGARGRDLIWEGRAWVARAADCQELPEQPLADWRTADLALLVESPSDKLCEDATRLGVVLFADLTADGRDLPDVLRQLARWPAVAVVLFNAGAQLQSNIRSTARNLLLAERRDGTSHGRPPRDWADIVVCEGTTAAELVRLAAGLTVPVIARRPAGWCDDLVHARRACDSLQRDLAGLVDIAGYVV